MKELALKFCNSIREDGMKATLKKSANKMGKPFRSYEIMFYKNYLNIKNNFITTKLPLEIIKISPNLIDKRLLLDSVRKRIVFNKIHIDGLVLGGNWDKIELENYWHYLALKQRFVDNKDWEETVYYDRINQKENYRGCENWLEFKKKHLVRWDKLYKEIKKNGYKPQRKNISKDLAPLGKQKKWEGNIDAEIKVAVGKKGEVFQGGNGIHRFTIAKILGVEKIPVIVTAWHKEYIKSFKEKISKEKISYSKIIDSIKDEGKSL